MKGKFFNLLLVLATTSSLIAGTVAAPDPNFHIYLAFGQSNMEGQGPIEPQDRIPEKRYQVLSTFGNCDGREVGKWYDAVPPLARCFARVGPMDYFGRTLAKKLPEEIKIGAVIVAVGGCSIQLFEKDNYMNYRLEDYMVDVVKNYGGNPYKRLIDVAKIAQKDGVIKGILFHQGESNNGQTNWPSRVKAVYENILNDLGLKAEEVPLLAGEVVQTSEGGQCGGMNKIINTLPNVIPTAHVVSSVGLKQQGDGYHFSTEAYREFGERYAEEMLKILGDVKVIDTSDNDSCWSEALGYSCCTNSSSPVVYTDDDGQWSVENNEWCGILKNNSSNHSCWANTLGYQCCNTSNCRNIIYEDNDGQWDVDNNQWCGITSENKIC